METTNQNLNPSWLNPDGSITPEHAPEDVRPVLEAKRWGTVNDIIKSYHELERLVGKKTLDSLPNVEWTDELREKVYEKLGVPKTPDGYALSKDYKPPVPVDESLLKSFREYALKLRLTPQQFEELVRFQLDAAAAAEDLMKRQYEETKRSSAEELKKQWKTRYDENFKKAKSVAEELGILDMLEETGLADNPKVIQALYTIAERVSESGIANRAMTQQAKPNVQEELKNLLQTEALFKRAHPEHAEVLKKYLELTASLQ